ncbi:MAG: hypothetical protein AMJ55_00305 [Gammaproteobacteria bacterium SG8_15]|nr:MAG: hypothetical protein AMJ55_00305 [Gammaproteobacteria bacterium SG8_15]
MDTLPATVLRSMLTKECWSAFNDLVKPDVFTNMDYRKVFQHINELHEGTDKDLTISDIRMELESTYKDTRLEELDGIVTQVEEMEPRSPDELRRYIQKFLQREYLTEGANYVAAHIHSGEIDVETAFEFFARARELASVIDAEVLDFAQADLPGHADDRPMVTSLGVSDSLDAYLHGGVGAGELLIYLAPPSRGKTSFLWATGAAAAAQGRNVLGITLELSARKCVRRVDQCLTNFTRDELIGQPLRVSAARKDMPGKLYIKDWSYTGVTVDDIKALVVRMRQRGEPVDYLLVDYLELVKPVRYNRHAERHNWSQTAQDLRALAVDLHIPVITAWQVNREGSEQHVLSPRDVSECWDIVKHADIILGLNQSQAEMAERVMRVNIIKQRESTERPQVYLYCDMDRMIIRDGDEEADDDTTRTVGVRLGSGLHTDRNVPA